MGIRVLKVSSKSNSNSIAGMIAALVKDGEKKMELVGIGAGALNQSVKAIATARGFLAPSGIDLICTPAFTEVNVEDEKRTGMKLIVEVK